MPATLRVPEEEPDLIQAVARLEEGGTIIVEGQITTSPVQIRKPLTIQGGTVVGEGAIVFGLHADVVLDSVEVRNPAGHGVVCMAGSPQLRDVTVRVTKTGIACGGTSAPFLERCEIPGCAIGLTAQDDAAPVVNGLTIVSTGSGLFLTGRCRGSISNTGVVAGAMPAVEINSEAAPQLEAVAVALAGGGGFFVHGDAEPSLLRCSVERTQLAAVEVRGNANPTFDGLRVRECQASGLYLHQNARGTYMALDISGCMLASIEVAETAEIDVEEAAILDGQQGGIWVRDEAVAELIGVEISGHALVGVDVLDTGRVTLDGCEIARNGSGIQVGGGELALIECSVVGNRGAGVRVLGSGRARIDGGSVLDNTGAALDAIQGGVIDVTPETVIEGAENADSTSRIVRTSADA